MHLLMKFGADRTKFRSVLSFLLRGCIFVFSAKKSREYCDDVCDRELECLVAVAPAVNAEALRGFKHRHTNEI